MLTETNYRVRASMTEQSLKEKRLWGHVVRTAFLPPPARVVSAAVAGTPAIPGIDAVNAIPAITRAMVDHDVKLIEDFHAAAARASYTLMQTLSQKGISAVMMLPDAADEWDKLANDYAAVSSSQSTNARSKFNNFKNRDGEFVIETQHRFDDLVNECSIQAIDLSDDEKTAALPMRPCSKWINFMDVYATMEPPPSSAAIFRAMKSQEERMITRNEKEYEEANFNGISGSRAIQPEWKRRPKIDVKRSPIETRSCYCCGEVGHLSATCKSKNGTCEFCRKIGHLAKACRAKLGKEEPEADSEVEESGKHQKPNLLWKENPKRLSFANDTKFEKSRDAEGMVARPVPYRSKPRHIPKCPEWLADSGSSQHVCNDLNMLWDVKQLEEQMTLQALVGESTVTHEGTVKLQCEGGARDVTVLHLFNTLYVPRAHTNIFSLQMMRKAGYRIVQDTWLPTVDNNEAFIKNSEGKTVGYIMEDESGRGTVSCKILMPPQTPVKNDFVYYSDTMAASGPAKRQKMEHNKTTPGFPDYEGAGRSLGASKAQTGQRRSDENVSVRTTPYRH